MNTKKNPDTTDSNTHTQTFRHIRFGQFVNKGGKSPRDTKTETEKSSKFDAKFTDESKPKKKKHTNKISK